MNCFTYVFNKLINEGGSVIIRQSKLAKELNITSKLHPTFWMVHFLHRSNDGVITEYTVLDHVAHNFNKNKANRIKKYIAGFILGLFSILLISSVSLVGGLCSLVYSFSGEVVEKD